MYKIYIYILCINHGGALPHLATVLASANEIHAVSIFSLKEFALYLHLIFSDFGYA